MFFGLGDYRTLTDHEAFAAVPAREMLRSGDFVVPRFGGMPRLRKPPLNYWLLAATGWIAGEFSEWTMRLPSAVASVLLAALVGLWARRWYGPAAGFAAALVQLTSVWVITYGRKAEVDMLLCLLTTAAMWLIAESHRGESRQRSFWRWAAVWSLLSIAWLAKFHYGPSMVLIACGASFLIERRVRDLRHWANPVGLALFAAAVLVWPALLLRGVPNAWEVWRTETIGRAVGELQTRPVWYYAPHLLSLALPWTPFALAAAPESWRRAWGGGRAECGKPEVRSERGGVGEGERGRCSRPPLSHSPRLPLCDDATDHGRRTADHSRSARERFLWVWLIAQVALLTLSANKHRHYLFAAMPVMSLLAAQCLSRLAERGRAFARSPSSVVSGVPLSADCRLPTARWLLPLAAGLALVMMAMGWIVPQYDHRRPVAEFARSVRRQFPSEPIGVYRMGEHPIVFYLDQPVRRLESAAALAEAPPRYVVTLPRYAAELQRIGRTRTLFQAGSEKRDEPPVLIELTRRKLSADQRRNAEGEPKQESTSAHREARRSVRGRSDRSLRTTQTDWSAAAPVQSTAVRGADRPGSAPGPARTGAARGAA